MTDRTRVRRTRYSREPLAPRYSTVIGTHAPTVLSQIARGRLQTVALNARRSKDTLFKWAEGQRGPETDLAALFPALRAAGVRRADAAMLVVRVDSLFLSAYVDELPSFAEMCRRETAADTAEDRLQMLLAVAESAPSPSAVALYQQACLAEAGELITMAARCERDLQERGLR